MTSDEILALPAGRDLDALVAEKIMGWSWWRSGSSGCRCIYAPGRNPFWMKQKADMTEPLVFDWPTIPLPLYSTDIAAAWKVVERLTWSEDRKSDFHLSHDCAYGGADAGGWHAFFPGAPEAYGETPELAICRAALLACIAEQEANP